VLSLDICIKQNGSQITYCTCRHIAEQEHKYVCIPQSEGIHVMCQNQRIVPILW